MSGKQSERQVLRVSLDEQRVAQYLFELFEKYSITSKKPVSNNWNTISPDSVLHLLDYIKYQLDYIKKIWTSDKKIKSLKSELLLCRQALKNQNYEKKNMFIIFKDIFTGFAYLIDLDFLKYLLETPEKRKNTVQLAKTIVQISSMIPFEAFSANKILDRQFSELSKELLWEAETFKDRNYSITFNTVITFLTSITLLMTVASFVNNKSIWDFFWSIFHYPFYYFVFVFVVYFILVFIWLFISNLFAHKARSYWIELIEAIKRPFTEHELIDDEYFDYIYRLIWVIWNKETKWLSLVDEYDEMISKANILNELKFWNKKLWFWKLWIRIISDYKTPIIFSWAFFLLSVIVYILLQINV